MRSFQTIAFISVQSDPAIESGSQSVYVRQLGEALSRLGWQVDMFTRQTDLNQANIVQHNPLCRTIRLAAGTIDYLPRTNLIGSLPEFLKQFRQFQLDNELEYCIIHTNSWLSAWVGMELKKVQSVRHIHTFHSLGAVQYGYEHDIPNIAKTRLAIEKACLETADLTIATCPQQRDYLRELVSAKGCVEILSSGTDTELFGSIPRTLARKQLEIESDIFNVLYVGKFDRISGVETLVRALRKAQLHSVADIRLTLVNRSRGGSPLLKKRIEKLIWDSGLDNITNFVAEIEPKQLAMYYAAADVCVIPSQYNPSGIVAMEAMASGTPVVAANLGGLKYVVQHEVTGLLFPAQNSFLLTRAIYRLATKPEMRSQFIEAGKARVEELFTWDIVAAQLSEFYLEQIEEQNLASLHRSLNYSAKAV